MAERAALVGGAAGPAVALDHVHAVVLPLDRDELREALHRRVGIGALAELTLAHADGVGEGRRAQERLRVPDLPTAARARRGSGCRP